MDKGEEAQELHAGGVNVHKSLREGRHISLAATCVCVAARHCTGLPSF